MRLSSFTATAKGDVSWLAHLRPRRTFALHPPLGGDRTSADRFLGRGRRFGPMQFMSANASLKVTMGYRAAIVRLSAIATLGVSIAKIYKTSNRNVARDRIALPRRFNLLSSGYVVCSVHERSIRGRKRRHKGCMNLRRRYFHDLCGRAGDVRNYCRSGVAG